MALLAVLLLAAGPVAAQPPGSRVLFDVPAGLTEVSGAAYGKNGVLYVHEDSGSAPVVTGLDPRIGKVVGRYDLGVDARDWEDIAEGPEGLYVADIGDNGSTRDRGLLVHVLPDPTTAKASPTRSVRLTYEDGPRDAETLLVHPRTGQVLVVTKFAALLFAAPQPFGPGALTRVGQLRVGFTGTAGGPERVGPAAQVLVTGGDVSPDGRRIAIRTYTDAYVYEVPGDDLVAALATNPTVIPLPPTPQGEAITWTPDGTGLVTASEGSGTPVYETPAPPGPRAATPGRAGRDAGQPPGPSPAPSPAPPSGLTPAPDAMNRPTRTPDPTNRSVLLAGGAVAGALFLGAFLAIRARRAPSGARTGHGQGRNGGRRR